MEDKITYSHCICCGSASIGKVLSCEDYTVSHEIFEVWECSNCTFRFTQNVPVAAHIGPYYQSAEYISHSDTKAGLVNRLYHIVRNFTLKSKSKLVKKVTQVNRGKLLDVGAGTGAFAHAMQQDGWMVTALEPDDIARTKAKANYQLSLFAPEELFSIPAQSQDAITLWHVLEHVHDLEAYLKQFNHVLKSSGRLIVAVPNYASYDARVYQHFWAAYDVPRHLYHFNPRSLAALLQPLGFTIEKIKPMWFDSFYVSMLSEKYQYGANNIIQAFWIGLVSNLKAVFKKGACSSVIYIIRKTV